MKINRDVQILFHYFLLFCSLFYRFVPVFFSNQLGAALMQVQYASQCLCGVRTLQYHLNPAMLDGDLIPSPTDPVSPSFQKLEILRDQ